MGSGSIVLVAWVLAGIALAWWAAAPVVVSIGDRRLKERNPLHHGKLVRFYRVCGIVAILIGLGVSLAMR